MALAIDMPGPVPANDADPARELLPMTEASRIGGDSVSAAKDIVEGWAGRAAAGDQCVYALGHLPGWSKGGKAMRLYYERGFVHLRQYRHRPGFTEYVAIRTALPWIGEVKPIRVARQVPSLAPLVPILLGKLSDLAEVGGLCPSNADWAEELGVTKRQAAYLFCCLEEANAIQRRPLSEPPYRVVTITKTGKSTGGAA